MEGQPFGPVTQAVASARALADLGPTAIWALLCLILLGYTAWREKNSRKATAEWMKIRTDEAVADSKMADAVVLLDATVKRMTEKIVELQTEVKVLCSIFLKEKNNP